MSFEVFKREKAVVDSAKALLEAGDAASFQEGFEELLKNYEKLLKTTRRLVRMSDRNEEELNRVARSLEEKNHMLEALSSKLSKYLSPQVYDSIFSGERDVSITTERKKLTVFFSDIKDFTQTTEDLQPEDLTSLLNDYFTEMSKIALGQGATIDKFIGDAMLMFFGDPETRGVKDDARACVQMAIEMQRRMRELREVWRANGYEKPFAMRIGISTGFCNVGNFGSSDRMDYTIIGGEVNLAARLEKACDPDGILMSYETYVHVRDLVDAEERPPITAKGIRREIRPFAALNIHGEAPDRFIRRERDGMSLFMDLEKIGAEERRAVRDDLKAVLRSLDDRD